MLQSLAKDLVLWSISKGMGLPQPPLDRISELTFLKELLRLLQIECVLDVGANRGQFAGELRKIGYEGQIISFEPVSTEFRALSERFAQDPRWKGLQLALGSQDGSGKLVIPELTVMSSLLQPLGGEKNVREETVQIRRLDGLLPSLLADAGTRRLFLKMDTQGFDLEVFRGASGCIELIQGIQSELSVRPLYERMPHYLEALGAYEAAGFELYNLSVVNRTSSGGLLELNCFMRRESAVR
jgi:FkbM family methyltransferase